MHISSLFLHRSKNALTGTGTPPQVLYVFANELSARNGNEISLNRCYINNFCFDCYLRNLIFDMINFNSHGPSRKRILDYFIDSNQLLMLSFPFQRTHPDRQLRPRHLRPGLCPYCPLVQHSQLDRGRSEVRMGPIKGKYFGPNRQYLT